MDVIKAVVTALAQGALVRQELPPTNPICDRYDHLRRLLQARRPALDLLLLEADPASHARQAVLAEELQTLGAGQDSELLQGACALLAELVDYADEGASEDAAATGVRLEDVNGAALSIADVAVRSAGNATAVDIQHSRFRGDVTVKGVEVTAGTLPLGPAGLGSAAGTRSPLAALLNLNRVRVDHDLLLQIVNVTPPPAEPPPVTRARPSVIWYTEAEIAENRNIKKVIGREGMLDQIAALLDACEEVLLCGMPGCGKTTLAAAAADQRIRRGRGPVLWVTCGDADAGAQCDAIAEQAGRLGYAEREKAIKTQPDEAKVQAVSEFLRHDARPGLVVLDNARDGPALTTMRAAVPDAIPLLATAREHRALRKIVEVGNLSPSAALDLLGWFAGADLQAAPGAAELCRTLGNHAYALEIAGSVLKVDGGAPAELDQTIREAPHATRMPEDFAVPGRESVKALLDDSVSRLDEAGREVFLAFGAFFAPGATVELLAACVGRTTEWTKAALSGLARRSLVHRAENTSYYRIHDLTFSYARGLSRDAGRSDTPVIAAVQSYLTQHAQDFDLLEHDETNLLAAAGRAAAPPLITIMAALVIGGYPQPRAPSYFDCRGHTPGLLGLLDAAIRAIREQDPPDAVTLHYLLGKRGNAHFDRGDFESAFTCYQAALDTAPDPHRRALCWGAMGKARAAQGQSAAADRCLQEGYQLAKAEADDAALCYILEQQTTSAGWRGDFAAARRFAEEAVAANRRLDDRPGLGYALLNLGSAELDLKLSFDTILAHHQEALAIAAETEHRELQAWALQALGEDHLAQGLLDAAGPYFSQAEQLFRELGMTAAAASVRALLARCAGPLQP